MKKILLLLIVPILLCGCEKKNSENKVETPKSTKATTTITTTSSSTTSTTTAKSTTTTKVVSDPTKVKSTTTARKLNANEYISTEDGKVHKFTFVYPDKETCIENVKRETPYDEVTKYKHYSFLGCEEVKDANGNSLWGIHYLEYADASSKFYY